MSADFRLGEWIVRSQRRIIERGDESIHVKSKERNVCGCDFGGTSWTTEAEAMELARLMRLDAHSNLLDISENIALVIARFL